MTSTPWGARTRPGGTLPPDGHAVAEPDLVAVFAALPGATAVFAADSPHFTLLVASDALCRAAGRPRELLVGRPLAEAFSGLGPEGTGEEGIGALRASLLAAMRTGQPQRMPRQRQQRRGGDGAMEARYLDMVNTPVRAGGAVRWILHQAEDVTERVFRDEAELRAEVALRETRGVADERLAQLEAIYRDAPVGLAVLDRALRYRHVNDRLAAMNGVPAAAHLGRTLHEVVPDFSDFVADIARRVLETGEPVRDLTLTGETPAEPGVKRQWIEQWFPLRDATGEIVGLNVVIEEVTERARADSALRESEAKYRTLFESIDEGYAFCEAVLDDAGAVRDVRFLDVNPAFGRMTGLDDVVGRLVSESVPGLEHTWMATVQRVLETSETMRVEAEVRRLGRWMDAHFSQVGGPASRLFAVVFQDVTERRRREAQAAFLATLSDAMAHLGTAEEIMRVAGELIAGFLGLARCHFVDIDDEAGTGLITHDWHLPGLASISGATRHRVSDFFSEPLLPLVRAGEAVVVQDVRTDARVLREPAEALGIRAYITAPFIKDGAWRFAVSVSSPEPRRWEADEVQLVRELAARIWLRIERVRALVELQETQRRLEDALATARMAYWTWAPSTEAFMASTSMAALFGLREGDLFTGPDLGISRIVPGDRERLLDLVQSSVARGEGWHVEYRILRPRDGQVAWIEERANPALPGDGGALRFTGLVWDITDRKRAEMAATRERTEREREMLRRELAAAEEAERRRLAGELHDQLGQHLTAFALGVAEARRLLEAGQPADARLAQLEELARAMTQDARYLALELRPPELDDVGLESALATYLEQWRSRYGVNAELTLAAGAGHRMLPQDVETALYRVVQEALTNVAKHAGASQVTVLLDKSPEEARLLVEDDGRGFDVEATEQRVRTERRLGLAGMRERLALVGGTLEVESNPGQGTTIYGRVPLEHR